MITTDFSVSSLGDYRNMEEDRRIKAGTSLRVIAHIMMKSNWPSQSFMEAAK